MGNYKPFLTLHFIPAVLAEVLYIKLFIRTPKLPCVLKVSPCPAENTSGYPKIPNDKRNSSNSNSSSSNKTLSTMRDKLDNKNEVIFLGH